MQHLSQKDLPAVLQLQSKNAEWSVCGPSDKIPWAAPGRGHDGVKNFLKTLGELLVPEVFDIYEYFEKDDKVVAHGFQNGYVRPTNVPSYLDIERRKVEKFRVYYDTNYVVDILSKKNEAVKLMAIRNL